MKKIIHFIQILFLVVILFGFQKAKEDEKIYWSPDRKLTWDDFKEVEKISNNTAISCSGIEYELYEKEFAVEIKSCFYKNKSWVIKGEKTDKLLKHEQGHFNIAELYARKLRKAIKGKRFKKKHLKEKIILLYNKVMLELNSFNDLYDKETNYHRNQVKQEEWNQSIENELLNLKEYSEVRVAIRLK